MDSKEVVKEEQRRLQTRFDNTGTTASSGNPAGAAATSSSVNANAIENDAAVKEDMRQAAATFTPPVSSTQAAAPFTPVSTQDKDKDKSSKGPDSAASTGTDSVSHLVKAWADTAAARSVEDLVQPATDIQPLPGASAAAAIQNSEPGAYPVGMETDMHTVCSTNAGATTATATDNTTATATDIMEVGHIQMQVLHDHHHNSNTATALVQELTEAEPVDITNTVNPNNLPMAQQFDQEKHQATKRRKNCILASKWIAVFFVALTIVIVIPVVVLQQDKSHTEDPTGIDNDNENATGMSPSQPSNASANNRNNWTTTEEEAYILSLLPTETVAKILQQQHGNNTSQTPQSRAFTWLINDPSLVLSNNNNSSSSTTNNYYYYPDWRIVQRFALATFYYASNGPTSWVNKDYWLNYTVHECEWFSKESLNQWPFDEIPQQYACEGYGNTTTTTTIHDENTTTSSSSTSTRSNEIYTKLWLQGNSLQGKDGFPEELYLLTSLTSLSLSANPLLEGTISPAISQFSNLHTLYFSANTGLSGSIPTEIGLMTELKGAFLFDCDLQGEIPSEIGLLTKLKYIFIDTNQLTGTVPWELSYLSNTLEHLYMFGNALTGQIPSELGALSTLQQLALDRNWFSGTIPPEFGQLSNCTAMNLKNNSIQGNIPSTLGLLTNVDRLRLHNNYLSGTIPTELGVLATNGSLLLLDLTNNTQLIGTIPPAVCLVGVNQTCIWEDYFPCELKFDCTDTLCGCDCPCGAD